MKQSAPSHLTQRELHVVHEIWNGRSTAQIAARLHISAHTVLAHRASIHKKLRTGNTAQLLRMALSRRWIRV